MQAQETTPHAPRWIDAAVVLALLLAVLAVYCPWSVLTGAEALGGVDHLHLHERRMAFAREALFGPQGALPAWYPRELLGTPFRANLQNFPLTPTRLFAFALFDPRAAFGVSVLLSAGLAAAFTYLFCRRLELSRTASAAAGWTFACAGFFASRVLAGHLPLLEAYPALPVLLYAVERVVSRPASTARRAWSWSLAGLAAASACFALVGHPQLCVYGAACAAVYACVRAPRWSRALSALAALAVGAGLAGFALAPMASLTSRSTRLLALDRAANDLSLPYGRIGALLFPWKDGWPASVQRTPAVAFHGYPTQAYFWDSVSYVGWAPCLAAVALLVAWLVRRQRASRVAVFFTLAGALAFALSLPWVRELMSNVPGTFLRSPSRLLFVVSFCLALALAAGIERLWASLRRAPRWAAVFAVVVVLAAHAWDLGRHARAFVVTVPAKAPPPQAKQLAEMRERIGDGRIGIDYELETPFNRVIDDVGVFESLLLARPYRFVLETSGAPAGFNEQALSASQLSARTLRACGVRIVWTKRPRSDLRQLADLGAGERILEVDAPQARAAFVASERVRFVASGELHRLLRDPTTALDQGLLFDEGWRDALALGAPSGAAASGASVLYRRPSSDEIVLEVACAQPGVVRVLEAWDPGWSATLDGAPAVVAPAQDTFLSTAVGPGKHELRFAYRSPAAMLGWVVSCFSLLALAVLARIAR